MSRLGNCHRLGCRLSEVCPNSSGTPGTGTGREREDPETREVITRPTHRNGVIDPDYLTWLRDTLKVFDNDGTVMKGFLDRLDPDCLEALDFNLSAGRHKPFIFDAGQHLPPAELIGELQALHGKIQKRLGKLLAMVGGGE